MRKNIVFLFFIPLILCCGNNPEVVLAKINQADIVSPKVVDNHGYKVIHVFVALCDNKYQGIVPVPATIGNGQNPLTNLYWGAAYGVKSYFKKSNDWILLKTYTSPEKNILERLLFKDRTAKVFLVADAYDGQFIKQTTIDFLKAASGDNIGTIVFEKDSIYTGGASDLIAYIGHDGLMDFDLEMQFPSKRKSSRETIILACYSKSYFSAHLKATGAVPLIWTTGLMAPEAYTLHDAIGAWVSSKTEEAIRFEAANVYRKHQKCSLKAAKNLLTGGW